MWQFILQKMPPTTYRAPDFQENLFLHMAGSAKFAGCFGLERENLFVGFWRWSLLVPEGARVPLIVDSTRFRRNLDRPRQFRRGSGRSDDRYRSGEGQLLNRMEYQRPEFDTFTRRRISRRGWIGKSAVRRKARTTIGFRIIAFQQQHFVGPHL
jgi:hypothetical protein